MEWNTWWFSGVTTQAGVASKGDLGLAPYVSSDPERDTEPLRASFLLSDHLSGWTERQRWHYPSHPSAQTQANR